MDYAESVGDRPTRLRTEHLDDPLGITERRPRLSWTLPGGSIRQVAYRLVAGDWDTGRVESDRSLLVPYAGPELRSAQRVEWTVKVWTDRGESDWADTAAWEMGLLDPKDWTARWIEPVEPPSARGTSPHPAWLLRGSVDLAAAAARGRLYVTAHGVYEFFVNGHRVGDAELTPGYTSYPTVLQVQTFDVTDLLVPGANALGAVLSDGWYRGQTGADRRAAVYGDTVALLAQLHVLDAAGATIRAGTDEHWVASTGAITAADLIQGQAVDLRLGVPSWCRPGPTTGDWRPAAVRDHSLVRLCSSPSPPVRRVTELRPVAITHPRPGRQVVDFGQNISGWVRLTKLGPRDTTVTLVHGEALDGEGNVTTSNLVLDPREIDRVNELLATSHGLDAPRQRTSRRGAPLQVDRVTSRGSAGDCFEPRHTTHGFRYVSVDDHPEELSREDVVAVAVHTDLRPIGSFVCSDDRINRLHEAAVWSFRSNTCDIPTDCPTRERLGWTGDFGVFIRTAAFLFDVAGFARKWLRDLAADQQPDGMVTHCVPNPVTPEFARRSGNVIPGGAAGFGDAAVIVPWEVYRASGDVELLADQWDSMSRWVDYAARCARGGRHPRRVASGSPMPHEQFIWDTGFQFGEWLEPGDSADPAEVAARLASDKGDIATAYLHHSASLLARIAGILGRRESRARYDALATSTKLAWRREFIRPDGRLTRDTQASYVRALAFDLVPDDLRTEAAARLVELIRAADTHVGTGFLATQFLLPVLADTGHPGVAYDLLRQDTEPSWLTMIDRGATTVWESWNGLDERGVPSAPPMVGSLNHYGKGSVVSFLHRYVGGIRLGDEPAYRRFRVEPVPGGGLTFAHTTHDSPHGRIQSSWHQSDATFTLDVAVPPGTVADVLLPDGTSRIAEPGSHTFTCHL